MEAAIRNEALRLRVELQARRVTPASFGAALELISPRDRDAWLDALWGQGEIPADALELPRGCVPYLPCDVETLAEVLRQAAVTEEDVFVDVGSGAGRAALLAHLATGAACVGLEVQPALARLARRRAEELGLGALRFVEGEAADGVRHLTEGNVFFLYCPFGGEHLRRFLGSLEQVARARPIRVCCVDMPPLDVSWLERSAATSPRVDVYRSRAQLAAL